MRRILTLILSLIAAPLSAEQRIYVLEPGASQVAFETDFGADLITGTMPVAGADIRIDFDDLAGSRITVDLAASGAQASFPFATEALRGDRVLATASFPVMHFETTAITRADPGAIVDGLMTIRGVTRPLRLQARLHRQAGTDEGDLDALVIIMTGALNRSDYGAGGWSDMVGDQVRLEITASIRAD